MANEKDFLLESSKDGNLYVVENVVKICANYVAKEVPGVYDLTGGIVDVFNAKRKGVSITTNKESLHVEVAISVYEDFKIIDIARQVRQAVQLRLQEHFELEQVIVDVTIKEIMVKDA